MLKIRSLACMVLLSLTVLGVSAPTTQAGSYHNHCKKYSYKYVYCYETRRVPYVKKIVCFDHCGKPYIKKLICYRTIKVRVKKLVKVYH